MRFLFIHQNFPGQFRHVSQALAARGHEVVALCVNKPTGEPVKGVRQIIYSTEPLKAAKVQHPLGSVLIELGGKFALGESAARAMEALRAQGFHPDVVAAHSGWGEATFVKDVFPDARFIAYAEYYYGGPGSDTSFDPEFSVPSLANDERVRVRNTHLLHALASCDVALTPTQFQKSRHPSWSHDRLRVIHEGIDTQRFRPDPAAVVQLQTAGLQLRAGDEIVTFVVRQLEPYRGYHIFMRALPLLQKLRPHARVVLVGSDGTSYGAAPPPGKTWREVFQAEVAPRLDMRRVHFVGRVPHVLLTQLMQVSAVHAYLTYPFVLSWSMLEAMSIGCLVIGSDTAPVREVIEDGRNGILTNFFDHESLAHKVADALARQADLAPLRLAARQTIVDNYDLATHCLPAQVALFEGQA